MTARHWLGSLVLLPGLWLAGCGGAATPVTAPTTATPVAAAPTRTAAVDQDPARFAPQVLARGREAGVTPRLVMAILDNESYKPHDPQLERAWQQWKPDAAFGVANMHRATFDATKRGRAFAGRAWEQLPDDPDLAIEAAAWYLHDLAAQLPSGHVKTLSSDELLALGYNAGPANMKSFARGTKPGPAAQSYLDNLRGNWAKAGRALGEP